MIDYNVEGMNKHILNANIKLMDENKLLKELSCDNKKVKSITIIEKDNNLFCIISEFFHENVCVSHNFILSLYPQCARMYLKISIKTQ